MKYTLTVTVLENGYLVEFSDLAGKRAFQYKYQIADFLTGYLPDPDEEAPRSQ